MELDFARLSQRAELLGELPSAIVALREVRETLKVIREFRQSEHGAEVQIVNVRIIHVGGTQPGAREWLESEHTLRNGVPEDDGLRSSDAKLPQNFKNGNRKDLRRRYFLVEN